MNRSFKIYRGWRLITAVGVVCLIFSGLTGCGGSTAEKESVLCGRYRGYNLVILVLDTLRADHLGCYGYFRNTSPWIDKLSEQAIMYENAFASIPITLPSHASILTGLYPQNSGLLYNFGQLPERISTLATILKEEGYQTAAIVSTAVLKKAKRLDRGFDEYYHNFDQTAMGETVPAWKAKGIAEDANRYSYDWLNKVKDERFFLLINYYDTHAPFIIQPEYWNLFNAASDKFTAYLKRVFPQMITSESKRKTITRYDRAIAYVDNQINELAKYLKKIGVMENTIIIITSDHGNGLYQHHDYWTHGLYLYDEQIKIPLILILPGWPSGRISNIVETVDLMPTILDLMGISLLNRIDGKSTIPFLESGKGGKANLAFAMTALQSPEDKTRRQYCVRTPNSKLIFEEDGAEEFYDLKSDPFEKRDIMKESGEKELKEISRMKKEGLNWLKSLDKRPSGRKKPDNQTLKELRALGYLQ